MKKSQLAINSVSTKHSDIEEALDAYSAAGFRNVEFVIPQVKDYLAAGHTLADVRRLLDQHRIKCIGGFETHIECFSPASQRAKNHALLVSNAKLLAELGGTAMVVGTDGPTERNKVADPLADIAKALALVAKQIRGTGVAICVEFNWSPVIKSLRTAVDVARRAKTRNVGVLFDPAHYHCTPSKFDQISRQSVPFIRHVHVDDMRDKPGELSDCNADRVLPGQGCLDLRALFGELERYGYKGFFSLEMFNDELWSLPAHAAARKMYQSLLPCCRN